LKIRFFGVGFIYSHHPSTFDVELELFTAILSSSIGSGVSGFQINSTLKCPPAEIIENYSTITVIIAATA